MRAGGDRRPGPFVRAHRRRLSARCTLTSRCGVRSIFSRTRAHGVRGSSFTNSCNDTVTLNLANDYDNASVTVRFESQSLSTSGWYIDDVAFWAI